MRHVTLAMLATFAVLAAALGAPGAQSPQKVVFALNWFAVGDHAAYWVALEKGYYRARGLEVELQNSKGSGDSIAKVDTGRADIGLADAAVVIPRIAQGARVKIVGAVFDNTPLNMWMWKSSAIATPKDLEGKTLAAPPGDAQRQLFPAFAKLHGIDASKVTWVTIEPAAKFVTLAEKRVDVVADYLTGLPFYEKALGRENVASMPWHKHGFDTYSMSVIASDKTLNERPRVLRDFVAASYTGWRDVMGDPRAALEIFKRRVPEIDLALIEPNLRLGLELMKTDRYAKHGIGWMDRAKMCATVELINTYMPDIPFRVDGGELVALVGPSGCGKSTLLRIIAGLRPATTGRVAVGGHAVTGPVPAVGMVFQAPILLKWRRIVENVLLPAELAGLDPGAFRGRALELLRLVGLGDFADRLPRELSGGMQQRAALCRALLLDPPLLLMDEPFGALDAMTRDELNLELLRVWGEGSRTRKTIVFVTHSIVEAVFLADRVVVLTPRPGRVAELVPVPLPRPRTVETRASPAFGALALQIHLLLARSA